MRAGRGGVDPKTGLYLERQEKANCGLHCVNNLLQGPFFDEACFRMVAAKLDEKEQELTDGSGLDNGNALRDGWFNVQVMQAVLLWIGYDMVPFHAWTVAVDNKDSAYILNKKEHWFALRRINQEWFELNSFYERPRVYTEAEIRMKVCSAAREGYSVFVVRGDFPESGNDLSEDAEKAASSSSSSSRRRQTESKPCKDRLCGLIVDAVVTLWCFGLYFFSAQKFYHRELYPLELGLLCSRSAWKRRRRQCADALSECCLRGRGGSHSLQDSDAPPQATGDGAGCGPGEGACTAPSLQDRPDGFTVEDIRRTFNLDLICSRVAHEETHTQTQVSYGGRPWRPRDRRPWLVVIQTLLMLTIWVGGAAAWLYKEGLAFLTDQVGLETMAQGHTLLLIHTDCQDHRTEAWRWLSYQFTFTGMGRLCVQLPLLLLSGIPIETSFGRMAVVVTFYIGLVAGGLGHLVVDAHTEGLSDIIGGCACFVGVHMANLAMNWRESEFRKLDLLSIVVMLTLLMLHLDWDQPSRLATSTAAPLAGLVAGLSLGAAVCQGPRSGKGLLLRGAMILLGALLAAAAACWTAQWPPRTILDPTPWCWARQVRNHALFGDNLYHCVRCDSQECIDTWAQQHEIATVDHRSCDNIGGFRASER